MAIVEISLQLVKVVIADACQGVMTWEAMGGGLPRSEPDLPAAGAGGGTEWHCY